MTVSNARCWCTQRHEEQHERIVTRRDHMTRRQCATSKPSTTAARDGRRAQTSPSSSASKTPGAMMTARAGRQTASAATSGQGKDPPHARPTPPPARAARSTADTAGRAHARTSQPTWSVQHDEHGRRPPATRGAATSPRRHTAREAPPARDRWRPPSLWPPTQASRAARSACGWPRRRARLEFILAFRMSRCPARAAGPSSWPVHRRPPSPDPPPRRRPPPAVSTCAASANRSPSDVARRRRLAPRPIAEACGARRSLRHNHVTKPCRTAATAAVVFAVSTIGPRNRRCRTPAPASTAAVRAPTAVASTRAPAPTTSPPTLPPAPTAISPPPGVPTRSAARTNRRDHRSRMPDRSRRAHRHRRPCRRRFLGEDDQCPTDPGATRR